MSLMLGEAVAKKVSKVKPKSSPDNRKPVVLQMRGSEEWKAWAESIAAKEGHNLAKMVEVAMRKFAKDGGYPDAPLR